METVIRKLLEVVEHLAYSHTFRSEDAARRVHELLGEARAALEPKPAEPADPTIPTPAGDADVPAGTDAGASDSAPGSSNG